MRPSISFNFLLLLIICCFLIACNSQTREAEVSQSGEKETLQKLGGELLDLIRDGKLSEVYSLMSETQRPTKESADLIEKEMVLIRDNLGKHLEREHVRTNLLGRSIGKSMYIEKYEEHFVLWVLEFYHNGESWKLSRMTYADRS